MLDLKVAITPAPNSTEAAEVQDNRLPSEDSGLASPGKSLSSLRIWKHHDATSFTAGLREAEWIGPSCGIGWTMTVTALWRQQAQTQEHLDCICHNDFLSTD